jgi:hypothetical protein
MGSRLLGPVLTRKWFAERCAIVQEEELPWEVAHAWMLTHTWEETTVLGKRETLAWPSKISSSAEGDPDSDYLNEAPETSEKADVDFSLNGVQVDRNKYVSVQRNAARLKGASERLLPKPVVIRVNVNGSPMRALVDSGSLGDFISSTAVDQLKLKRTDLDKPSACKSG